ncbi:Aldo/keto reductase [Dentipellis sp. KUC8613]|nr:Aldo/keto reductase [Dentipellis sp. KUC8613]
MSKSALNIVMGAMTFGAPGKEGARVHDLKDVEAILDVFQKHGHTEIDTARVYAGGTSEEYLGKIDWQGRGLKMETKLYPNTNPNLAGSIDVIKHTPEGLRLHLDRSLKALNTDKLEMWYLHGPDRSVPYEVTLKTVNELYKEGKFNRFGISNYMAWEVAEMVLICRTNGWIQPTAYQGIYNAIHRSVEPELFPCLRKFGISFYEFNPLGGGFFTGRYRSLNDEVEPGSRFDPNKGQGQNYRKRYWKEPYFKALAEIQAVSDKHNLTMAEVALRWISHHSLMKREFGDSVLIGASSVEHIEQNLIDLEKGPLPDEVLSVLDEAWIEVQPYASKYFH